MQGRDVFISHVEEDAGVALAMATALRSLDVSSWTYEEDGLPGVSYLTQIYAAIDSCRAFILIASPASVNAHQVIREVEQAHERRKMIIVARNGLTHQQFVESNPILRMSCGTPSPSRSRQATRLPWRGVSPVRCGCRARPRRLRHRARQSGSRPRLFPRRPRCRGRSRHVRAARTSRLAFAPATRLPSRRTRRRVPRPRRQRRVPRRHMSSIR